jgi:hypothetical protein
MKETNRAAFIALMQQDLEGLLPLVYTPVIAEACLNWGTLIPRPLGLYVGAGDDPLQAMMHWPSQEVRWDRQSVPHRYSSWFPCWWLIVMLLLPLLRRAL